MLHLPRKNETKVLQVLRRVLCLPRKTNLRCSKPATQNEAAPKSITRRQTSANLYEGAQSAAPATQNELEMLQVLRLPRKTRRRPKASSSLVARFPPTSMKVLQVLALATQNEPEVLQVLRLPRKTSRRCSKCCGCHAKRGGAQKHHSSPDFRRPPRRCSKCCACHANNKPEMLQALRLPCKTRRHPKASPVAKLPPTSMKVLQVLRLPRKNEPEMLQVLRLPRKNEPDMLQALRLPRKTSLRRACHAKRGGAQKHHSSPDFRQPLCRCAKCCACHAKTSLRLPRKTRRRPKASHVGRLPPTPMKVLQVLRLPRKNEPDMLQALRLPRKTSLRRACHAKRGGTQKHHSSPDFRQPL